MNCTSYRVQSIYVGARFLYQPVHSELCVGILILQVSSVLHLGSRRIDGNGEACEQGTYSATCGRGGDKIQSARHPCAVSKNS